MNRKPVLPLALCLLLTSCATVSHPSAAPASTPPAVPTAEPLPAPEWGEQVYTTAFVAEGRADPVFVPEYRLPRIENADGIPAYEAINAYYAAALEDLSISSSDLAAWAMDDFAVTQATGDPFFEYVDTERYELTMESATRVSVLRSHYSNSGGPYPTLYPLSDTFDLTTGERLSFASLFSCPAQEAEERVWAALAGLNAQGAYSGVVLDEATLKAAFSPENFYLTESALTVYIPSAELPQAVGIPTFAIPYADLEDILTGWE